MKQPTAGTLAQAWVTDELKWYLAMPNTAFFALSDVERDVYDRVVLYAGMSKCPFNLCYKEFRADGTNLKELEAHVKTHENPNSGQPEMPIPWIFSKLAPVSIDLPMPVELSDDHKRSLKFYYDDLKMTWTTRLSVAGLKIRDYYPGYKVHRAWISETLYYTAQDKTAAKDNVECALEAWIQFNNQQSRLNPVKIPDDDDDDDDDDDCVEIQKPLQEGQEQNQEGSHPGRIRARQ